MTPDRTAAAIEARRRAAEQKLQQVRDAIAWLQRRKTPVTYPAVAAAAGVSRTFLYDNPDARALMTAAGSSETAQRQRDQAGQDARPEASWRERALNAEDALKAAHAEIRAQRDRIGQPPGPDPRPERDFTAGHPADHHREHHAQAARPPAHRRTTGPSQERLEAARSNNRFADRRIAQLEAQLTENTSSR